MQHIAFIQNNNLLQYNALICNATQIYAHTYIYIYIQLRKTAQINNTYHLLHIPSNSQPRPGLAPQRPAAPPRAHIKKWPKL